MDVKLIETGNGGDLRPRKKDLFVIEGMENMPYLGLFGGSVNASTPAQRLEHEQAFDWWGNSLFYQSNRDLQFNSLTEARLIDTPLTSAGRIRIEEAVKEDLKFMSSFADIDVTVTILAPDVVKIFIVVKEPDNLQAKEFVYIWDATRKEVLIPFDEDNQPVQGVSGFDYFLDFEID